MNVLNSLFLLTTESNQFDKVVNPIITLINNLVAPAMGIVTAIAALYCVILGAKLAKAEEPQEREKAKGALKNAVIGFLMIFILLFVLKAGTPIMNSWLANTVAK